MATRQAYNIQNLIVSYNQLQTLFSLCFSVINPRFMATRPAYNIQNLIVAYNLFQTLFSLCFSVIITQVYGYAASLQHPEPDCGVQPLPDPLLPLFQCNYNPSLWPLGQPTTSRT